MERILDIEHNKRNENNEISSFIKELENALKNNNLENTQEKNIMNKGLYDEVLIEIELAPKYKSKLNRIIKECMKNESYENEFWYIDYDKTKNTYSMDYYIDGQVTKTPLTSQEVKDYELIVGMTYLPYEDDRLMPMVSIKDSIKIDVDSALFDLELKNKKKIKWGIYEKK